MEVIIPAAGRATRFNGVLKELLPIPKYGTPLAYAVKRAYEDLHADSVTVVTSMAKIGLHADALRNAYPVNFRIQRDERDLWGAIRTGLADDDGGLIMADTVWEVKHSKGIHPALFEKDIVFGTFYTREPQRFSVLVGSKIHTKDTNLPEGAYAAWGCVLWSKRTAAFWREHDTYLTYDTAFQHAVNTFTCATFQLTGYNDLGTLAAYGDYLREVADDTKL